MTIDRLQRLSNSQLFLYGLSILLSVAGILLVLHRTAEYGVGLNTSDAVNYLSAAHSFADGDGYLLVTGGPYVKWPPLFPTLLAVPTAVGVDPLTTGRYLNALAFGLSIFLTGKWLIENIEHRSLIVLGVLSVFLAEPLVRMASVLSTEPVYVLLTLLFCLSLSRFLYDQNPKSFGWAILWAALATLQRYIGMSLIAVGGLLILFVMPQVGVHRRLLYACLFGVFSTAPIGLWVIRDYRLNNTLMGSRVPPEISMSGNLRILYEILEKWVTRSWWLPDRVVQNIPGELIVVGFLLLIVLGMAMWLKFRERVGLEQRTNILVLSTVIVTYLIFLLIAVTLTETTFILKDDRFVLPVYVFFLWLSLLTIDMLVSPVANRKAVAVIVSGLVFTWAGVATYRNVHVLADQLPNSMYVESEWHESELMEWVREELPEGKIYSNDPLAVYVLAGRRADRAPSRKAYASVHDLGSFVTSARAQGTDVFFVMFNDKYNKLGIASIQHSPQGYFTADDLASVMDLELLVDFDDGACYRLK